MNTVSGMVSGTFFFFCMILLEKPACQIFARKFKDIQGLSIESLFGQPLQSLRHDQVREVTYLRGYINVLPVWSDLHNLLIAYSILVPALASGTHGYMVSSAIRQCSHNELIGNDHGKTFSSCLPNQLNPGDLYQSIAYCLVPRKKPLHFGAQRSLLREPKIHGGRL